jgi:hypothetical protein
MELTSSCSMVVASILYSYSFEQNPKWSREYPGQEELLVGNLDNHIPYYMGLTVAT